jgi:hypothetical protein
MVQVAQAFEFLHCRSEAIQLLPESSQLHGRSIVARDKLPQLQQFSELAVQPR